MGIAKTINAVGEYNFYSNDYRIFVKPILELLNVNLNVDFITFYEDIEAEHEMEHVFFDNGSKNTYNLTVEYFKYDDSKPLQNNVYCDYSLNIPVKLKYEDELILNFYETGIFQLNFLPFNSTWNFFIEDIIGDNDYYFSSHLEVVKAVKLVRDQYLQILDKINCKEVVIWTDAYYKTENLIYESINSDTKLTLKDIVKSLKENDKISLYNFADVVNQKTEIKSFRNSFLDIAFYDNFEDKIEISKY